MKQGNVEENGDLPDEKILLEKPQTIEKYGWGWRHIITALGCFSTFANYMLRVNMSMAIVVMVNQTAILSHSDDSSGSILNLEEENSSSALVDMCWSETSDRVESGHAAETEDGSFLWNTDEQGMILAAFFYGYSVLTIPGGVLATKFGGKWVNGGSMMIAGVLTFFTPLVAEWSVPLLVAVRFAIGLALSTTFPATQCIVTHWIPPCERSKLPVLIFTGGSIGTVVCFGMSGFIISAFGWASVFYITGAICFIWLTLWGAFASNSPKNHKWISEKEREFIMKSIAELEQRKHKKEIGVCDIPWKNALTSFPVWAIFVSHFCMHAGVVVYITMMPLYFRTSHGLDIRNNGMLTALPFVAFFFFANTGSQIADFLRSRKILNTTHVRKLFCCSGQFMGGVFMLLVSFAGCDTKTVIILLVVGLGLASLAIPGFQVNTLDVAPQYAGVLLGCSISFANISGFIVPSIVGVMTKNNETLSAWRHIFYIFTFTYWFGTIFYFLFGSGVVQSWAKDKDVSAEDEEETTMKTQSSTTTDPSEEKV